MRQFPEIIHTVYSIQRDTYMEDWCLYMVDIIEVSPFPNDMLLFSMLNSLLHQQQHGNGMMKQQPPSIMIRRSARFLPIAKNSHSPGHGIHPPRSLSAFPSVTVLSRALIIGAGAGCSETIRDFVFVCATGGNAGSSERSVDDICCMGWGDIVVGGHESMTSVKTEGNPNPVHCQIKALRLLDPISHCVIASPCPLPPSS
ncbi:hypothetical protein R3P38DRAFT_3028521, partial [Favolaschia claudopus]